MTWWQWTLLAAGAVVLVALESWPRRCHECGARSDTIHSDFCASRRVP